MGDEEYIAIRPVGFKRKWLDFQTRRRIKKEVKSQNTIQRITQEEQYKEALKDKLRRQKRIEDMAFGVVVNAGLFNKSKGYYISHLNRKLPDIALEYLYDNALRNVDTLGTQLPQSYVAELRYRAERRTARLALAAAIFAATTSLLAIVVTVWLTRSATAM